MYRPFTNPMISLNIHILTFQCLGRPFHERNVPVPYSSTDGVSFMVSSDNKRKEKLLIKYDQLIRRFKSLPFTLLLTSFSSYFIWDKLTPWMYVFISPVICAWINSYYFLRSIIRPPAHLPLHKFCCHQYDFPSSHLINFVHRISSRDKRWKAHLIWIISVSFVS